MVLPVGLLRSACRWCRTFAAISGAVRDANQRVAASRPRGAFPQSSQSRICGDVDLVEEVARGFDEESVAGEVVVGAGGVDCCHAEVEGCFDKVSVGTSPV
jgi:hypothetical protein